MVRLRGTKGIMKQGLLFSQLLRIMSTDWSHVVVYAIYYWLGASPLVNYFNVHDLQLSSNELESINFNETDTTLWTKYTT